jgi:hypothetical protein
VARYEAHLVIEFEAEDDEAAERTVVDWLRRETGRNGRIERVAQMAEGSKT